MVGGKPAAGRRSLRRENSQKPTLGSTFVAPCHPKHVQQQLQTSLYDFVFICKCLRSIWLCLFQCVLSTECQPSLEEEEDLFHSIKEGVQRTRSCGSFIEPAAGGDS